MRLNVMIKRQRDGTYLATSPTVPDCVSEGKTPKEAIENHRTRVPRYVAASSDCFPDCIHLHVVGANW